MRYFFYILFFLNSYSAISQQYNPYTIHYTQKDYGDSCHLQNVSLCQGKNGLMYFGNNLRVLEYDGVNWRGIRIPLNGGFVTALTSTNHDSLVYVGANAEFGYITENKNGESQYFSLSDKLNPEDQPFGRIWKVLSFNKKVAYLTEECIYIFDEEEITLLNPSVSFHNAFVVNDELLVRQREKGLMKYQNDSLVLIPNTEIFKTYGIFAILPVNNYYVIVTQELGLYKFFPGKKKNNIISIKTKNDKLFIRSKIFGAKLLKDKKIALNTEENGLIIIDSLGTIHQHFNTNTGLPDNGIREVLQDNYENIWLATNLGIVKINYSSPISNYSAENGLYGIINDVVHFNGRVYVASGAGLYSHEVRDSVNIATFKKVSEFTGIFRQLLLADSKLLVASSHGIYQIKENKLIHLDSLYASALYHSKSNQRFYAVGDFGIAVYDDQWRRLKLFERYKPRYVKTVVGESKTNEKTEKLWVGTDAGLYSYCINENFEVDDEFYSSIDTMVNYEWIIPFEFENKIIFSHANGGLKYWDKNSFKNTNLFKGSEFESQQLTHIVNDAERIWFCADGKIKLYHRSERKISDLFFRSVDFGVVNKVGIKGDKLWICADNQLISFSFSHRKNYKNIPQVLIRKVIVEGSTLFNSKNINNSMLKSEQNSIHIQFASLYEENKYKAEYSFILNNYDESWSEWNSINEVNYKKIPAGDYQFYVKARDIYGNESEIKKITFSIMSPWYNTVYAYFAYFVLLVFIIWGAIKLKTKNLRRLKDKLEIQVARRTEEIRIQKEQIEVKNAELKQQNEEIQSINESLELQRKLVEERNSELFSKNEEIVKQRDIVTKQKESIIDSITYAQKIQQAILPEEDVINEILDEHFILYIPRDIVSGDFYWIKKIKNFTIVATSDCTGHGVPGAFMSMLGISFLNEIVSRRSLDNPAFVLERLRNKVKSSLHQQGKTDEEKDGMDMSLYSINEETLELQFAGAFNSIYIVRENGSGNDRKDNTEFFELKADRQPISIFLQEKDFTNQKFQLKKGDCIYSFSDGYTDQFGGVLKEKFLKKRLRELILTNAAKPMEIQKKIFEKAFYDWKGDEDQLDDVVLIGVRI